MGPDDSQPHDSTSGSQSTTTLAADPSHSDAGIPMATTSEIMLIIALVIIFFVILSMTIHLFLRHRYRRKPRKAPKKKDLESGTSSELSSAEKKVFEAAGTEVILCELPQDAPPLVELDAGEVIPWIRPLERAYTRTSLTSMSSRSSYGDFNFGFDAVSPEDVIPDDRRTAVYWSARL